MTPTPSQPDQSRPPSRAAAVLATVLAAVLVGGLLVDLANFEERYIFIRPQPIGDDSVAVADTISRNRVLSYMAGMAAREAAGQPIQVVYGPADLGELSMATPDDFEGVPQAPLNKRLIQPVVRGRLVTRVYDTVLPDAVIERFQDQDRLVALPRGVYAVKPDGGGSGRVVLYSDEEKLRLFAVPEELAPL